MIVAVAFAAFYLAVRVAAIDRRVDALHRRSSTVLACAALAVAVFFTVDLLTSASEEPAALRSLELGLAALIVVTLTVGFYFLYGQEYARVRALRDASVTHQARSRRLEAIVDLSNRLRATLDTYEVAEIAADTVRDTLQFRETALYLRQDGGDDAYRAAAVFGQDPEYDEVVRERTIPGAVVRGLLRDEFRHGDCCLIDHTRYTMSPEEEFYFPSGPLPDLGPGMFHPDDALFVPLFDRGHEMIGLFDVYDPVDGRIPDEATLQMLQVFANVTASALENACAAEDLRRRAVTDGLTGLYNHRHFQETLAAEVQRADRYGLTFTLLMMDLDRFKTVNDRFGHPHGDQALQEVAAVLQQNARASDFVARYGGEEFVMLVPGTTVKQAGALAERIAQGVRDIVLEVPDPPPLSISVGMADYPVCGRDRESLIAAADAALLFAKRSGRDMVADFSEISLVELDQESLEGLSFRLERADLETLEALAGAVAMRDAFADRSAACVTNAARCLAEALGLGDAERDLFATAAVVYDIGKVAVPIDVLNRRGELSPEERATIRRHPKVGKRLLESVMRLRGALPAVVHHHERWDGTGYPDGLKGEETPLLARAIALCDAYQAMVVDRPYRKAMSQAAAFAQLRAGAGTQFDPYLVEVFVGAMQRQGAAH
ncbi:MAG TPA: diguanylate cyclase [Thermoleophilia bacterium]|nr:diguanylate cyclase [Thermoleophilia bacterium]